MTALVATLALLALVAAQPAEAGWDKGGDSVLPSPPNAWAQIYAFHWPYTYARAGRVEFNEHGDKLTVTDQRKDGHYIWGHLEYRPCGSSTCDWRFAIGILDPSSAGGGISTSASYIPENVPVQIQACVSEHHDYDDIDTCTDWYWAFS